MTNELVTLQYQQDNAVALVTLNRPERYNALTTEIVNHLLSIFEQITDDDRVRAMVLTGAGKGFCAGQDITEFEHIREQGIPVGEHLRNGYNKLIHLMRTTPKPIVGAIGGVAAGAGASLTLGCDLRIAADDASFVFGAFLNVGLIPDTGATYLLPQIVGVPRALDLMLLGDGENRLDAQTAYQYGLVNRVVPRDELLPTALATATRLASLPPLAVGMTKQLTYANLQRTLADALEVEAQQQDVAAQTQDHLECVAAFLAKRPPNFNGK
jgi:2-(1,2-epoxy-1,2-dihydrophenyl)acetyl-CoA isomerase